MSHSKHHRRRTGFGMEMLETRKLAAIIGPPNAGIEDLGADVVDTTVNPHADPLIHAQLANAEIEPYAKLLADPQPHEALDPMAVVLVMNDFPANDPGDFDL